MTKITSISLPDEMFELLDEVRGSIPRSTFVSEILVEKLIEPEPRDEFDRVFIDFSKEMSDEFEELIKFYRNFSMQGVTQNQFFTKIFEIGTENMKCTMNAHKKMRGE